MNYSDDGRVSLDDAHIYSLDRARIPGVTEVLTQTGIASYPDIRILRDARYRGTIVHQAIEMWLRGSLEEESMDDQPDFAAMNISGYFTGAKRYIDAHVAKVVRYEWIVWHRIFLYAGKLDALLVTNDGRLCVIDWKSGSLPWWVGLQTGAYLEAILSDKDLQLESDQLWHGAVQLNPDGTYVDPILSLDRSSFSIFRQALNVVNYTNRRGK